MTLMCAAAQRPVQFGVNFYPRRGFALLGMLLATGSLALGVAGCGNQDPQPLSSGDDVTMLSPDALEYLANAKTYNQYDSLFSKGYSKEELKQVLAEYNDAHPDNPVHFSEE